VRPPGSSTRTKPRLQHVAASASSKLFAPASPLTEFVDPVKPRPGQDIIVKSMPSSFVRTTLDDTLRSAGIETVVICGLATHMCVDSTTRDAVTGGYKAIVPHDACASRDLPGPDGTPISARSFIVPLWQLSATASRMS
jgi:nicotinamidase-related amidase